MADYVKIQKALNDAGATPPLVVDGVFGTKSLITLKAFQTANGLVADGIPGPKTLAALGLGGVAPSGSSSSTMGSASSGSLTADQRAYAIAKRSGLGLTEAEIQYCLSVARGEGGYGEGWAHPSAKTIELSQRFGLTGYEGTGSNNWGAIQGSGDAGSFMHVDHRADGTPYVNPYRKYSTPEKGFADVARIVLGGGLRKQAGAAAIKAAINKGNLRQAVTEQRANGYFELAADKYLSAMLRNYEALTKANNWKRALAENGVKVGLGFLGVALLGGLGYCGYRYWQNG